MRSTRVAPSGRLAEPPSRRVVMTSTLAAFAGGAHVASTPAVMGHQATRSTREHTASATEGTSAWTPKKVAINRKDRAVPHPLLSHAVRSGPLVFLSGIGGWYPEDRAQPGDARIQIDSALRAMKMLLEQAGSSMANVLKVHMTVADPNRNLPLINEGYKGHFPEPPPARSYSGCAIDQMGREDVLVQVDCVAVVD